jgi:hypothetical protein
MVVRVPSLPVLDAATQVQLGVADIDFLELTLRCEFLGRVEVGSHSA